MVRLSVAPAVGVVVTAASDNAVCVPALTVTDNPAPFVKVPSVTVMLVDWASYRVMTPFLAEATVATPLVNVIAVVDPKLMAVPELLTTVGWVALGELAAPAKVRFFEPV